MPDEKIDNEQAKDDADNAVIPEKPDTEAEVNEEANEQEEEHHKRKGFFGSREAHITKKELKELNRELETSRDKVKQLEKELAEKSTKASEYYDKYLRLNAETENFKKRMQREISESIRYASEGLIIEMFPALNNFQMALLAAENVSETRSFAIGMEMILKQVMDVMKGRGLEEISPAGETFDPRLHHAILITPSEACTQERVSKVIRKGYKLHDKVLQPAAVEVEVPVQTGEQGTQTAGSVEGTQSEQADVINNEDSNKEKTE